MSKGRVLIGAVADLLFDIRQMIWCKYHPDKVFGLVKPDREDRHSAIAQPAYRFERKPRLAGADTEAVDQPGIHRDTAAKCLDNVALPVPERLAQRRVRPIQLEL